MSDESEWDLSVTWYIENYSLCSLENGQRILSPTFTVDAFDNKNWSLSIYPKGMDEESEEYALCFLGCVGDMSLDEQNIDFKIQIKSADQSILVCTSATQVCIRRGRLFGSPKFIKIDKLLSELKKCYSDTLILHWCLKKCHKTNMNGTKEEIRTRITNNKSSFEWNVSLDYLESKTIKRHFYLGTTLYQISIAVPQDEVAVSVHKIGENSSSSHPINGQISLLDLKGNKAFSEKDSYIFDGENVKQTWNFPSLISKKQLLDNLKEYEKEKGTVVLLCEFSLCKTIQSYTLFRQKCGTFTFLDVLISLNDNYQKLFVDKTNSDLILRVSDKNEIPAHKSVLAAQSPVFSVMFNSDMSENRNSIVDIVDIDAKCMEYFLQFLYTGYMDNMDYDVVRKMLLVVEKYQVDSLKEKCSLFLISVLSVENVCEILLLPDMVDREFLKTAALNYAADNYLTVFPSLGNSAWIKENVK